MNTLSSAAQPWQAAFDAQRDISAGKQRAFADFLARGLPTTKLDAWKYTDLRRLTMRQFRLAAQHTVAADNLTGLLAPKDGCRLVFVDGQAAASPATPAGLKITLANTALSSDARPGAESFELLNIALATNSVRIEVAENKTIDQPIYLVWVWTQATSALMTHPRVNVSLQRNAKATVIEHHMGLNHDANFTNAVLDIAVGEHATFEHLRVQDDATNFNISSIRATVASGATYRNYQYVLGGSLARTDINVQLTGSDAQSELYGLIFAQETQHLDVRTCIEHQAPDTRSREDYRGIADQRGRIVFNGKVIVAKDAQRTDAAQSSRNLLLSPHAEVDTRPELEIYANDVKCAHGATVGQLDATALFYLRSRGIAYDEARALLTHAFAAELIERLPVLNVREHILARVMSRMRTEGAMA